MAIDLKTETWTPENRGPAEPQGPPRGSVERVQELIERSEALADPEAREVTTALTAALMELYGEGLERIVDALEDAGDAAAAVRAQLIDDGVVASLLLMHDLYPIDLETRVGDALDSVRPYLESHGGDVELVGIEDGVARLRLEGSCRGCAASAATLELAIQQALDEHAPDLLGLDVEGVAEPGAHGPIAELETTDSSWELPMAAGGGWPADDNGAGAAAAPTGTPNAGTITAASWTALPGASAVTPGQLRSLAVSGVTVIVANVGGSLLAYRDECAACSSTLGGGELREGILSCPSCQSAYDLPRAGLAVGDGSGQLAPVPLLERSDGEVTVALPA